MRRLSLLLALVGFLVNPSVGCAPEDPEFNYGAAEMRTMVEGTWELGLRNADGSSSTVVVTVAQGAGEKTAAGRPFGLVRPAMACSSRSLVRDANACIDTTSMPLDVTLVSKDSGYSPASLSGSFTIHSLKLGPGQISIKLDNLSVSGRVGTDGTVTMLSAYGVAGVTLTSLTRTAK
jgi:hypothetical protein